MHGINPKRWFYGFRDDLQGRGDAARRSLSGAAAEHWLTGELFRYLASNIGEQVTLYPEDGTRDLTLYPVKDGHANWAAPPVASIEVKLIYRAYSAESIRSYVRRLIHQVAGNGLKGFKTYGYLFAIFVLWDGHEPKARPSFSSFRALAGRLLHEECTSCTTGHGVVAARSSLETLLDEGDVKIGGATARVGVAGQYLAGRAHP
jgi:hypothetical protein